MQPIAFDMHVPFLGTVPVGWYGLLTLSGVLAALVVARAEVRRVGLLTPRQATDAVMITALASLVCGHLTFLLTPAGGTAGIRAGSVLFGAIFGGAATVAGLALYHRVRPAELLDAAAPAGVLPPLLGRLGCFMAGCCYGTPTGSAIGVTFTDPAAPAPRGIPLHPTQLYEAAFLLALFLLLQWRRRRRAFPGELALLYVGVYSIGRFVLEFLRGDEIRGFVAGGRLSLSQAVALASLAVTAPLYAILRARVAGRPA